MGKNKINHKWILFISIALILICIVFLISVYFIVSKGSIIDVFHSGEQNPDLGHSESSENLIQELSPVPEYFKKEIPQDEITYPINWPLDLILPNEFKMVEVLDSIYPNPENTKWSAAFIFNGTVEVTHQTILEFLQSNNWEIVVDGMPYLDAYIIMGKKGDPVKEIKITIDSLNSDPDTSYIQLIGTIWEEL